jgi:glutamine synthetase
VPGYEAPVYVGWAQTNRSALIRIPRFNPGVEKGVRAELRCPDPSCNPYLAINAMLAVALDGVDHHLKPSEPLNNVNVYELNAAERAEMGIDELPGSLNQALNELEKNEVLKNAMGPVMFEAFMRAKRSEWENYRIRVMDWEVAQYLETA